MEAQKNAKVQPVPVPESMIEDLVVTPFSGEDMQLLEGEVLILPSKEDVKTAIFTKTFGVRPAAYILCAKRRVNGEEIPFELWLSSLTRKIYQLKGGKLPEQLDDQKVSNCGGGLATINATMAVNGYKPYAAFTQLAGMQFPVVSNFRVETYARDSEGRTDFDKRTYKLLYQLGQDASEEAFKEIPNAKATEEAVLAAKAAMSPAAAAGVATKKGGKAGKKS